MQKKESTFTAELLETIDRTGSALSFIFENPHQWARRALFGNYNSYRQAVYALKRRGAIEIVRQHDQRFLKLTAKGELEILLAKAKINAAGRWDGKWRMIIFDIPEDTKKRRDQLRRLLKENNFYKLQASVYLSPYALNREAINYLQKTGLMEYIRIARIDEMDNDRDLRRRFHLKS